jgi:hypothetical protein
MSPAELLRIKIRTVKKGGGNAPLFTQAEGSDSRRPLRAQSAPSSAGLFSSVKFPDLFDKLHASFPVAVVSKRYSPPLVPAAGCMVSGCRAFYLKRSNPDPDRTQIWGRSL